LVTNIHKYGKPFLEQVEGKFCAVGMQLTKTDYGCQQGDSRRGERLKHGRPVHDLADDLTDNSFNG
jgi:hypothetical protein